MKEKNHAIEFYRIIATLIICIHHMQSKCGLAVFAHGDLCVDFFFILSGLFLAEKFIKETVHSGSEYFIRRIKRLYPEYLFAAVIGIISYSVIGKFDIKMALPELFMVQNTGLFYGGFNYPCWYLSTLVFASFLLYECLKYKRDLFVKIIAPIVVLSGYTYIVSQLDDPNFIWSTHMGIHVPMLRCVCGLTLGIFIRYMAQCGFVNKISRSAGTVCEIFCIVISVTGVVTDFLSPSITVSAGALLVFITYTKRGLIGSKLLNQKIFSGIGEYSYSVYLNHGIMANTLDTVNGRFFDFGKELLLIYLAAVIVYSVISHKLITAVVERIKIKRLNKKVI